MKVGGFWSSVAVGWALVVGCGEDGSDASGDGCVQNSDCPAATPKCSQAGKCVMASACDVDADCPGEVCNPFLRQCTECNNDSDCPSQAPVCVSNGEAIQCAVCREGDSSVCPVDTWCVSHFPFGSPACEPSECGSEPTGDACRACRSENYSGCDGAGGECADVLAALRACYTTADPTWDERNCPLLAVPSLRGCSPQGCAEESSRVDACLGQCAYVRSRCDSG